MDVLVVEPLADDVLQWLRARHAVRFAPELANDPLAVRLALSTARAAILPSSVMLDATVLWHTPHLKVVGRISAGVENIDLDACARAGVEVARATGATAAAEAEFVVGALLALLRRVPIINGQGLLVGRELGAGVIGIVGATATTAQLARVLAAFGARVLGYDPGLHAADPSWAGAGIEAASLQELMRQSDGVCILINHFSRYDGLFGERLLGNAKLNQVIVSLSHSAIFDEQALAKALRDGPLAAAWLDSLEPGALDPGGPLRHIDTLQVTPRVASTTHESLSRSAWVVVQRIDELLTPGRVHTPAKAKRAGASVDPAALTKPA